MKDSWQLTATRTIDLGCEQLLILEGERGTRVKVLFRGVWLGDYMDPQRCVPNREANVGRGARNRPVVDLLGGARIAMDEPTRRWRLQWLADAIRTRLLMAFALKVAIQSGSSGGHGA